MNKSDLVKAMADAGGISQNQAKNALDGAVAAISGALANGERVSIPDFGSFEVRHRNARTGRNPQTGAEIQIAASNNAAFKAGKKLRDQLN